LKAIENGFDQEVIFVSDGFLYINSKEEIHNFLLRKKKYIVPKPIIY